MERNILIGNGINIAFSKNEDYKNYAIISRLTRYLETERYIDVFEETITSSELMLFLNMLNTFFNKRLNNITALKAIQTKDEFQTLLDISRRYHSKSTDLLSIGFEDYFFVVKMLYNMYGDIQTPLNSLFQGTKILFLDSIYNDGKIENLYTKMFPFKKEMKKYNKIFTVNYDTNLDKLTDSKVYHLHGSFDVLDDTYRPETIIGYLAQRKDRPPTVIKGMEHLYCNAIMSFSGNDKMNIINSYSNGNMSMDILIKRLSDPRDNEAKALFNRLKDSTDVEKQFAYQSLCAKQKHPELCYTEYPFEEFKTIKGELYIIGMSPNNDSHIFSAINNNPDISQVIYLTAGREDTIAAQKVIKKPTQIMDVFKYWKSIGC